MKGGGGFGNAASGNPSLRLGFQLVLKQSGQKVKWGAVITGAAKSSFHWMTTVVGVTCLYSMI